MISHSLPNDFYRIIRSNDQLQYRQIKEWIIENIRTDDDEMLFDVSIRRKKHRKRSEYWIDIQVSVCARYWNPHFFAHVSEIDKTIRGCLFTGRQIENFQNFLINLDRKRKIKLI
jgi:hypothetical protein